jgi:N6-L-threonylcarbamoyladenine synthase
MRILAIETSCDETGISILETRATTGGVSARTRINVLANELLTQASIHASYGGVFPTVARREHAKSIIPLITHALTTAKLHHPLKKARVLLPKEFRALEKIFHKEPELFATFQKELLALKLPKIDAIAVTAGPGLEPALWVGINTAQALGVLWDIPVIPVNHMEGHIVASLLAPTNTKTKYSSYQITPIHYPALALLISGGHTELVLIPRKGTYKILGQTRDDAVGEAFDKVARMLGLTYPGGPEISKLAEKAPHTTVPRFPLPRPMLKSGDFDFSFAGLKTAVLYTLKTIINPSEEDKACIAKEFEDAATEVLVAKTLTAAKKYRVSEIILGGGVTANKKIRSTFQETVTRELPDTKLFIPNRDLSTDNGLMIGIAGLLRTKTSKDIRADGTLRLAKK